jgi:hypothetical protein
MRYFGTFPVIDYNDQRVVNLIARVKVLESAKNDRSVYHPFVILDGETPQKIAYDYYGSTEYIWIIFLMNNIIDPYYEWPLSTIEFEEYIKKKYGSLAAAQSEILYYKKKSDKFYLDIFDPQNYVAEASFSGDASRYTLVEINKELKKSKESYDRNPDVSYLPVYAYDEEQILNNNRRHIKLLDQSFKKEIDRELKALLNGK